jgi:hypothetical protein
MAANIAILASYLYYVSSCLYIAEKAIEEDEKEKRYIEKGEGQ